MLQIVYCRITSLL